MRTAEVVARRLVEKVKRELFGQRRRPPTVAHPLAARLQRLRDPRPPLHILHIGKTGGTALVEALLPHAGFSTYRLVFHGHDVTIAHVPRGEQFMFVVRDPAERFVSAFNARRRCDAPRYHYPWNAEERRAFSEFATPNELAAALSAADRGRRERAERAMRGIGHLKESYAYWLGDKGAFLERLRDVFLIGLTERLGDDFELLKQKLGLPEAQLPTDPIAAHRAPRVPAPLVGEERENIERWYAADFAYVQLCRELHLAVARGDFERVSKPAAVARLRRFAAAAAAVLTRVGP